jgi:hypothetical protein
VLETSLHLTYSYRNLTGMRMREIRLHEWNSVDGARDTSRVLTAKLLEYSMSTYVVV